MYFSLASNNALAKEKALIDEKEALRPKMAS